MREEASAVSQPRMQDRASVNRGSSRQIRAYSSPWVKSMPQRSAYTAAEGSSTRS